MKERKSILQKINDVDLLKFEEIDKYLRNELNAIYKNGNGSRCKYIFSKTVWSVHHKGTGFVKHGIIRELKGVLKKEGIL